MELCEIPLTRVFADSVSPHTPMLNVRQVAMDVSIEGGRGGIRIAWRGLGKKSCRAQLWVPGFLQDANLASRG